MFKTMYSMWENEIFLNARSLAIIRDPIIFANKITGENGKWQELFKSTLNIVHGELSCGGISAVRAFYNWYLLLLRTWDTPIDENIVRHASNTSEICLYTERDGKPLYYFARKEGDKLMYESSIRCCKLITSLKNTADFKNRSLMVCNCMSNLISLHISFSQAQLFYESFSIMNISHYIFLMFVATALEFEHSVEIVATCYIILTDLLGDCPSLHRFRAQLDNLLLGKISVFRTMIYMNFLVVDLLKRFPDISERLSLFSQISGYSDINYISMCSTLVNNDYSFGATNSVELFTGHVSLFGPQDHELGALTRGDILGQPPKPRCSNDRLLALIHSGKYIERKKKSKKRKRKAEWERKKRQRRSQAKKSVPETDH